MKKIDLKKIMLMLSVMGALLSLYLVYTTVTKNYAICPNNGCEVVGSSKYSYFLGLPVAMWGLGYYLALFLLILKSHENKVFMEYFKYLLIIGIIFTLYLRYLEFFVIGAICIWCWISVVVIALMTVAYLMYRKSLKS